MRLIESTVLSILMLCAIMLNAIMINAIMLNAIVLNNMLSIIKLRGAMLCVIFISVIIMSLC